MADRPRHFEADIPYVHSTMNNITLSQLQAASDRLFVRIDIETKLQPLRRIKERNRQINHKNTLDVLRSLISENQTDLIKSLANFEESFAALKNTITNTPSTFKKDPSSTDTKIIMNYSSKEYKSIADTRYDEFIKNILNVQKYVKMYAPLIKDPKYKDILDGLVAGRSSQYTQAVELLENLFNLFDKNDMNGSIYIKGEQLIFDKDKWDKFIESKDFYVDHIIRGFWGEVQLAFDLKLNEKMENMTKDDPMYNRIWVSLLNRKQVISNVELAPTGAKYVDMSFIVESTGDKIWSQIKTRKKEDSPFGVQYIENDSNGSLQRKFIVGSESYDYKTTLSHGLTSEQMVVLANLYNLAYGERLKGIHVRDYPVKELKNLFNYQLIKFTLQNISVKELPGLVFINNDPMWTYDYFIVYWKYILNNRGEAQQFLKLNKIHNTNRDLYQTKLRFLKTTTDKLTRYGRVKGKYKGKKGFENQRYQYNDTSQFKRTFAVNEKNRDMLNSIKDLSFQHALLTYPNETFNKTREKRA